VVFDVGEDPDAVAERRPGGAVAASWVAPNTGPTIVNWSPARAEHSRKYGSADPLEGGFGVISTRYRPPESRAAPVVDTTRNVGELVAIAVASVVDCWGRS
jgi:hypothetical protein